MTNNEKVMLQTAIKNVRDLSQRIANKCEGKAEAYQVMIEINAAVAYLQSASKLTAEIETAG